MDTEKLNLLKQKNVELQKKYDQISKDIQELEKHLTLFASDIKLRAYLESDDSDLRGYLVYETASKKLVWEFAKIRKPLGQCPIRIRLQAHKYLNQLIDLALKS